MGRPRISLDVNMSDADSKRRLLRAIAPMSGLYDVLIKPVRETRSNQANRYYWGVIIREFHKHLHEEQGESFTEEECHEFLKCKFLLQSLVNRNTGAILGRAPRSTADLDKLEFGQYLVKCINWLQTQFEIEVPAPGVYGVEVPQSAA